MSTVSIWAIGLVGFVVGYITGGAFRDDKFCEHGRECYKRGYKRALHDSQPSNETWVAWEVDDIYSDDDNIGRA